MLKNRKQALKLGRLEMMAYTNRNRSFLSIFWNRLKRSLVQERCPKTLTLRTTRKVQFLERCLVEDCLVEKVRKQLEQQWLEIPR